MTLDIEAEPWASRPGETLGAAFERAKSERDHFAARLAAAEGATASAFDHDPGEVDESGRYPVEVALEGEASR